MNFCVFAIYQPENVCAFKTRVVIIVVIKTKEKGEKNDTDLKRGGHFNSLWSKNDNKIQTSGT